MTHYASLEEANRRAEELITQKALRALKAARMMRKRHRLEAQPKKRRGNCYVTCEALYHLLGGQSLGLVPHTVRHEGVVHWYLVSTPVASERRVPIVIDPTASQFKTPPPYHLGRGRGFLTKQPSRRARALMETMLWQ